MVSRKNKIKLLDRMTVDEIGVDAFYRYLKLVFNKNFFPIKLQLTIVQLAVVTQKEML